MIVKTIASLLLAIAFLVLPSISAYAQGGTTGRIVGTVKDANGAIIPGAKITVRNLATGVERRIIADPTGYYSVVALTPGAYEVSIAAIGFNRSINNVEVKITQTIVTDWKLEVGDLKETVTTGTAPPQVQGDGPQLGRVVDSRTVSE